MAKRIIVTATHAELHKSEGPWTYCIPMTNAYCNIHNIPFQNIVLKTNPENRHFSWAKIPVLHKFIDSYDEVLFISEYSTIINQKCNVFEYIKSAPEDKKWITRTGSEDKPILYTLSDKSERGNPLTSLFLLDCRNKQAAKDLLNNWWNDVNPTYLQTYPYEQHVLPNWRKNVKKASQVYVADVWSVQEFEKDQVFIQLTTAYKNIQTFEAKRYMFRMLNKKTKKVGIFVRQSNYYSSGAGQNCIFIKHSLEAAGYIVDLLVDHDPSKPSIVDPQIPYTYTKSGNFSQYGFILFGSYVPSKETLDQIRGLGIRTAMFHPMNSFDAIQNDHFIHGTKTSIPLFEEFFHTFADEVWLLNNHELAYKSLLEIQNHNKIPVRIIPITWAPLFTLHGGISPVYNYDKSASKINLVIMEPNMSYVKNAWMPLVIAEKFYTTYKPHVNKVYLIGDCADEANKMIDNLSIAKEGKLRKIGRMQINEILKFFCVTDKGNKVAFISHNIQCPLNYAYFDVMNAGIPFLHNSKQLEIQNMGFMYSNIEEAVKHLETILHSSHDAERYNKSIQSALVRINPYNEKLVKVFENLVENKHETVHVSIVSTQNTERLHFMKKQFEDIAFPYKYTIFPAYTPENSSEYFNAPIVQPGGFSDEKNKMYICGIRSHVDALYACIHQSSAEYFLIIEDDVAFRTDVNIKSEIDRYISIMKSNPEIHYASLSYRPVSSLDDSPIHNSLHRLKNDKDLYWEFNNENTPHVWGAQVYLISRYYASKFVNMFKTNNLIELTNAVKQHYELNRDYSNKISQLIIDSIMPIFLNQSIAYPMIGVEQYFSHAISSSSIINDFINKYILHTNIPYYNNVITKSSKISAYIVSTFNDKRIEYMKKQILNIKFPIPYTFFKSYVPETSVEFLDMKREEPNSLLCCMRSHIGALELALRDSKSDYFLIMEDDVAFQVNVNIEEKLNKCISILETSPDVHYISVSYLPTYVDSNPIVSKLHLLENKLDDIYCGFDKVDFTVWGSQAYVISREKAKLLVSIFCKDKLSQIDITYKTYLSSNKTYANKNSHLIIDAIMPYILNQAILYPQLCIETYFKDSISTTDARVTQWEEYCKSIDCKYYAPE
jgi:GR25 family glycosyltransferase involved in LPS biosynthesis